MTLARRAASFSFALLFALPASNGHEPAAAASATELAAAVVFQSDNMVIQQLTEHVYQHISYLETTDFGRVPCNGMLVVNGSEAIVFDTPTDNEGAMELIRFAQRDLGAEIKGVIPTHFHKDCVGGIEAFNKQDIPVYASHKTISLLKSAGHEFAVEPKGFEKSITLPVGDKDTRAEHLGEGHTIDNIIGYFPADQVLFGGCLIKEIGAGKGYLGDANTNAWPETVRLVKQSHADAKVVIPGHGKAGGTELLDYTINLFQSDPR